jgi:parallel beta-helix repeat protein
MKYSFRVVVILVSFCMALMAQPTQLWTKTYGGVETDIIESMIQSSDGGFILTGYTESSGNGSYDLWIVKTDSAGDEIWSQTYGGIDMEQGFSILELPSGDLLVTGSTSSIGAGYKDVWLLKTDATGNEIWNQTYGGADQEFGKKIILTNDGGYAILASTNGLGSGEYDIWLIKTDADGIEEWSTTYGGFSRENAYDMIQTSDGGFAILGSTTSFGDYSHDAWLIKTYSNESGTDWEVKVGGAGNESGFSIIEDSNNNLVFVGLTTSTDNGVADALIAKYSLSGAEIWNKSLGSELFEKAFSISESSLGTYFISGYQQSLDNGAQIWCMDIDGSGNKRWEGVYGSVGNEIPYSAVICNDKSYVLAGIKQAVGSTEDDGLLVKLSAYSATFHVSNTGSDANPGDESEPFATIQAGINCALTGDTVLVQPGTYFENINFNGKNIVVGSLMLTTGDTNYIQQTVIDAGEAPHAVEFSSNEDSTAVLLGFTILNGSTQGIFCENSSPNIRSCTISHSVRGIWCWASSPRINDVVVTNNDESGIWIGYESHPFITNSTISNNNGGGIHCTNYSNPTLVDVHIEGNHVSSGYGGGLFADNWSNPQLLRVTILDNQADMGGGGIYVLQNSTVNLDSTLITNNYAVNQGGGIRVSLHGVLIANRTEISGNSSNYDSGNYFGEPGSTVSFANCTVYGAGIHLQGDQEYSTVANYSNSILWVSSVHVESFTDMNVSFSALQGGESGVTGDVSGSSFTHVIDDDPLFTDSAGGDLSLTGISPCIDAGDPGSPFDPDGTIADMGAYYYHHVPAYEGPIWHVTTMGSDSNDGSSLAPFATIQTAVDVANDGDTVFVHTGIYSNPIAINDKSIVLIGVNGPDSTVITTHMLHLMNTESQVDGFTIQQMDRGLQVWGSSNSVIRNCRFLDIDQEALKVLGNSKVLFENVFVDSARHGFYISDSGNAVIANSTVIDCYESNFVVRDGASALILNSIAYGGPVAIHWWTNNPIDSVTIYNSMMENGWAGPGSGNIEVDPRFVDYSDANAHLSDESYCIGAGIDSVYYQGIYYYTPDYDLAGVTRPTPAGSLPDIGAYENILAEPIPLVELQNLDIGYSEDLIHIITNNPDISYSYSNSFAEPLTHHQVQVTSFADFFEIDAWDSDIVASADTLVIYAGNTLEDGETYYLRVKLGSGGYWSEWSELTFRMNSTPTPPMLLSPTENLVVVEPLQLTISTSSDAELDPIQYQYFVFDDNSREVFIDSSQWIADTSWQVSVSLSDNNQYWWYARSYDGYEMSELANASSFLVNTENNPPGIFNLTYPEQNGETTSLQPVFTWTISFDPDPIDTVTYTMLLDTPAPGIMTFDIGNSTSWQLAELLADNTEYFWKVVASDLLGFETENTGGYFRFTTNQMNENPSVVDLIAPDSVMILTLTPEMYWTPALDPDPNDIVHYEIHWWGDGIEFDSVLTDTNAIVIPYELEDNSQYFWEVIAMDQTNGISRSEETTFWIDLFDEMPVGFALLNPENNASGLSPRPSFLWEVAEDPDPFDYATYTFHIATDSAFTNMVITSPTAATVGYEMVEDLPNDTEYWWRVIATDRDTLSTFSETFKFTVGYVSIAEELELPTEYVLQQNYPNPFNPTTTLRYGLPEDSEVSLSIYDIRGKSVKTFVSKSQKAGWHEQMWNGLNDRGELVSTGIYLARLQAGSYSKTIKMLYLK